MDEIEIIQSGYVDTLLTKIRNANTPKEVLQDSLTELGSIVAKEIIAKEFLVSSDVKTPLGKIFKGVAISDKFVILVSTKDDYNYFLKGISKKFINHQTGYIDFAGKRGTDVFQEPIRTLEIADIPKGTKVDSVIIAKSVLATGCTAISLARNAFQRYTPNKLIIASCFYSVKGITEFREEFPNSKIFVCGNPDELNNEGLLVPGIGNIDSRIK